MKLTIGTKILVRMAGRMYGTRVMSVSPSGEHVFLGANPSSDHDCVVFGWRKVSLISVVEVLDDPPVAKQKPNPVPAMIG